MHLYFALHVHAWFFGLLTLTTMTDLLNVRRERLLVSGDREVRRVAKIAFLPAIPAKFENRLTRHYERSLLKREH